jgi:hypothetical protein
MWQRNSQQHVLHHGCLRGQERILVPRPASATITTTWWSLSFPSGLPTAQISCSWSVLPDKYEVVLCFILRHEDVVSFTPRPLCPLGQCMSVEDWLDSRAFKSYFSKIHFNIIFPSTPRSPLSHLFCTPTKSNLYFTNSPYTVFNEYLSVAFLPTMGSRMKVQERFKVIVGLLRCETMAWVHIHPRMTYDTTMTSNHSATTTYVMWLEEHLWNVGVPQGVYFSSLVY